MCKRVAHEHQQTARMLGAARKEVVRKRIVEKFGYGAPFKFRDRPITDKDIEEDYADLLEDLEAGVDYEGPRNRITAWRADD